MSVFESSGMTWALFGFTFIVPRNSTFDQRPSGVENRAGERSWRSDCKAADHRHSTIGLRFMTRKNRIERGEKVSLELTQEERTLLLNVMHGLTEAIRDVVRATPIDQPVMLTLDDLDDLEWHVAAEATHTKDKKLRQRLEAISKKLLGLMDLHNDEPDAIEGPETLSFVEQFVEFMVGPGPLVEPLSTKSEKGDDQYGVKLTEKQRESILHCTEPSEGLRRKIQQAGAGVQTLGFTRDELDELAFEVDYALADARTPHKQRLAAVYDKLEKLLDALELAEQRNQFGIFGADRSGLPVQGDAQRQQTADLASFPGAGSLTRGATQNPPDRDGLAGQPHAPVHGREDLLWAIGVRRH